MKDSVGNPHQVARQPHPGILSVLIFCLAALLLVLVQPAQAGEDPSPHILVLNSYHPGYKGSDDAMRGFLSTVRKDFPHADFDIEFLDSKHHSGPDYDSRIVELLALKHQGRRYDLIFITDDYAFNIMEAHRERLFGDGIPVVFCGTNSMSSNRLLGKKNILGVDEKPSFLETLELILVLHPETRDFLVIHDHSITGRLNVEDFQQAELVMSRNTHFTFLAERPLEELIARVGALKPGTVIFYFASYVDDVRGHRIPSEKALRQISDASPVPVYGGWEFNLGHGIVGGKLVYLEEHGALAGSLAMRILKGEAVHQLPPVFPSPNPYMFDARELQRHGIPESLLPEGSHIVNRSQSFFQQNATGISIGLIVVLFLAITLAFLLVQLKNHALRISLGERTQAEESLRESQRQLARTLGFSESLMRAMPVPVFFKDMNGRYLGCNQAFTEVTGISEDELKGKRVDDIWPADLASLYRTYDQMLVETPTVPQIYEGRIRDRSGQIRSVIFSKSCFGTPEKVEGIVGAFLDLTDRLDAEKRLQELNRTLEQRVDEEIQSRFRQERLLVQQSKMAAMGEMIGAIAHQWRQPLNAVAVIVQDIGDAFAVGRLDTPYLKQAVTDSLQQLQFMSRTIDDFRNFFRPDKARVRFDVKQAMGEVLSLLGPQLGAHGISWRLTCHVHDRVYTSPGPVEPCEGFTVDGYENELKQVFLSLVENARYAIAERMEHSSGTEIAGQILIDYSHEKGRIVIRVSDNGGGIPAELMDRIFEPYFTTKEQGRGTGIGLYMAKMIVENNMGGRLSARNADDGAEFRIELDQGGNA